MALPPEDSHKSRAVSAGAVRRRPPRLQISSGGDISLRELETSPWSTFMADGATHHRHGDPGPEGRRSRRLMGENSVRIPVRHRRDPGPRHSGTFRKCEDAGQQRPQLTGADPALDRTAQARMLPAGYHAVRRHDPLYLVSRTPHTREGSKIGLDVNGVPKFPGNNLGFD
jgi:hypothetical protein